MIDHLAETYRRQNQPIRPSLGQRLAQGLCWIAVGVLVLIALLDVNTHLARRHINADALLAAPH